MEFEAKIIEFLQANAGPGWITFFQMVTMLGSYLGFVLTFIIIFVKNKKLGVVFAFTFALGCVINYALKHIIARPRPFDSYPSIHNYGGEDGFSFPSGHSVCGGMFASFLIFYLQREVNEKWTKIFGTIMLSLFPILIAFSRVVLGVHYPLDTIIGIFIGIMFAIIGIYVYTYLDKRKKGNKK